MWWKGSGGSSCRCNCFLLIGGDHMTHPLKPEVTADLMKDSRWNGSRFISLLIANQCTPKNNTCCFCPFFLTLFLGNTDVAVLFFRQSTQPNFSAGEVHLFPFLKWLVFGAWPHFQLSVQRTPRRVEHRNNHQNGYVTNQYIQFHISNKRTFPRFS